MTTAIHSAQAATSPQLLEAELLLRLNRALTATLDTGAVISAFFRFIQPLVTVEELRYTSTEPVEEIHEGTSCKHHCSYRLNTDTGYLGEILFGRDKRFREEECQALENLLVHLIQPLSNSLTYRQALAQASRDPLTGIGNRSALDQQLERELQLAERDQQPLSLLLIDLDHFKDINDRYGHQQGDYVLREVVARLRNTCRTTDLMFRYGGEEFVILLGRTGQRGAEIVAERLRRNLMKDAIKINDNSVGPTVSIGISTYYPEQRVDAQRLFEDADQALYQAKADGRNRVISRANNARAAG